MNVLQTHHTEVTRVYYCYLLMSIIYDFNGTCATTMISYMTD